MKVKENNQMYHKNSPLLCGVINEHDRIKARKIKTLKKEQYDLFDHM